MYASCVACCPLVSHVEYVLPVLLFKKDGTDGWTAPSIIKCECECKLKVAAVMR